ncbi:MAG: T9SS C-terminal target domain-containing protein [Ignavibacteriae bacterium]|nr:MAG: T9SS C-terminal target domain-containing protein [Ignavibacteriota bacterium]
MKFFTYFIIIVVYLSLYIDSYSGTKFKAKDQITTANNYAQSHYAGGVLCAIFSDVELDSTGKAMTWSYYYINRNITDSIYEVHITINVIPMVSGQFIPPISGLILRPLGGNFCNSDESTAKVENAGGREFRRNHPQTNIIATILKLPSAPDTSRAYWTYIYNDAPSGQNRVYNVDGITCQIVIIGINNITTVIPEKFGLYQNYPNPFNPATKIKFDIPVNDYVILSVYDITGKEVSVIVSEQMKAGTYEAVFDASNLPSGAYFYRLQASGYSESKKMLILK